MFLIHLKQSLGLKETERFQSFYETRSRDTGIVQKPALTWLGIAVIFSFVMIRFGPFASMNPSEKFTLATAISFFTLLINIVIKGVTDLKQSITMPVLFAAEQFEDCYDDLLDVCLNGKSSRNNPWFKARKGVPKIDKLVIVVDNLDRCHKEMAYELLTVIKNFLGNRDHVSFVIPFDENGLHSHFRKNKDSETTSYSAEASEFLRKLFNVTIRIKPFRRFALFDFTSELSKNYQLFFTETTIDMISKQFATNPRRIIQFCNNLTVELESFKVRYKDEVNFATKNQSLICKALIVREEWPAHYAKICENPVLLSASGMTEGMDQACALFLRETESIGQGETFALLDKIVSVVDRSAMLPLSVQKSINAKQITAIQHALTEKTIDHGTLLAGLVEMLNQAVKNGTWQTGVCNVFETICLLNKLLPFEAEFHNRVKNEIRSYLQNFVTDIYDKDALCSYAVSVAALNQPYLKHFIAGFIRSAMQSSSPGGQLDIGRKLFTSFLKACNPEDIEQYRDIYRLDKASNKASINDYDFDDRLLGLLFDDAYFIGAFRQTKYLPSEEDLLSEIKLLGAEVCWARRSEYRFSIKLQKHFLMPEKLAQTDLIR